MTDEIFPFIEAVKKDDFSDQTKPGIPMTGPGAPYLGRYVCVGPVKPVAKEGISNQQTELNFTGPPGTASALYYSLTFQLLKSHFNVVKIDEWIEVSPTHREYYERTMVNKSTLEGTIKEGLRSAAQAAADFELVKHDMRKYKEMADYFDAVRKAKEEKDPKKKEEKLRAAEHVLKSMFVDQVDIHTGDFSLFQMVKTRWPTITSDFYALTEDDDTVEKIMKKLNISKAEAVVLKNKNALFREWIKLFGDTVKDRYQALGGLVRARRKSVEEYKEWIKPYISRYKAMKVGHERPGIRAGSVTGFADLAGQASFANVIKLWVFKPYRAIEYKKAPLVKTEEGKGFTIDPYDDVSKKFIMDPKLGLASLYPWLLNKGEGGKTVAENIVDGVKKAWKNGQIPGTNSTDLYYVFFEIDIERVGSKLPVGELEDITFNVKTWTISQNVMLVKLVEKECKEREIERYIEEMIGASTDEGAEEEKEAKEKLFGKKAEPGEIRAIANELKAAMAGVSKGLAKQRVKFVKYGPYENSFDERITKMYLIPIGRVFGEIVGFLMGKMGVG